MMGTDAQAAASTPTEEQRAAAAVQLEHVIMPLMAGLLEHVVRKGYLLPSDPAGPDSYFNLVADFLSDPALNTQLTTWRLGEQLGIEVNLSTGSLDLGSP